MPDVWCQSPMSGSPSSQLMHASVLLARHCVKDKGPSLTESQLAKQLCHLYMEMKNEWLFIKDIKANLGLQDSL